MGTQILHWSLDRQVRPGPGVSLGLAGVMGDWQELSYGARAVVGLQQRGDASEAVLGRLEALEADVRFLCTELGAEKLLWSSRFLELLREQQSLHQRVSPCADPAPTAPLTRQTLTPCSSCRSCHGSGTEVTAPSCWGKQRTKVPVGARERTQKVEAGNCGGAPGTSSWGGGTCHQSWGWGSVLTSGNGQ